MRPGLKYKEVDFTLGTGCVIGLSRKEKLITILLAGTGEHVRWSNGDDKRYPPSCVRTDLDFLNLVSFLAEIIGCRIEHYEWPYGPAYLLT